MLKGKLVTPTPRSCEVMYMSSLHHLAIPTYTEFAGLMVILNTTIKQ
uniref:Uncharacterized protein n=1 Tax=Rhizophora mucronata TaxID=61149 RepID=A0A2P2NTP9_RHIMU